MIRNAKFYVWIESEMKLSQSGISITIFTATRRKLEGLERGNRKTNARLTMIMLF